MKTKNQPPAAGEAAHTPTPYRFATPEQGPRSLETFFAVMGDDGRMVAKVVLPMATRLNVGAGQRQQAEANAAFIVRACNSHAALVAALEIAQERITELSRWAKLPDEGQTQDELRAALNSANGVQL